MPIDFACLHCDDSIRVGNDQAGRNVTCRTCGQVMRVPRSLPPPLPGREQRSERRRRFDEDPDFDGDSPPLPKNAPDKARDLGQPFQHFDESVDYRVIGIVVLVVGFAIALFGLLYFFAEPLIGMAGGGVGLVIVLIGVVTYFNGFTIDRMWICPGGFVWQNNKGFTQATWRDVRRFQPTKTHVIDERLPVMVFNGGPLHWDVFTCVLGFKNGQEHDLEGEELIAFLTRRIIKAVVPMYLTRIENGHTVTIHPFALSDEELRYDEEALPWAKVSHVDVRNNEIQVRKRGRGLFAQVELDECSMAAVFLPLAVTMSERHAPPTDENRGRDPFDFD